MATRSPAGAYTTMEEPRHHRGWLIGLGIGLAVLGLLAIAASVATTIASVIFIGVLLLVGGLAEIVHAFSASRWSGVVLTLLGGILYAVVGGLMVTRPVESALTLTLLLAAFFIVAGLFRILAVPVLRMPNGGWVLASGIVSFLLGAAIWAQWPVSGVWVIGTYVGVEMLVYGISLLMLGLAVRDVGGAAERRRAA